MCVDISLKLKDPYLGGIRCRLEVNPQQPLSIRWIQEPDLESLVSFRLTLKEFPDVTKIVEYHLFYSICIYYVIPRMFEYIDITAFGVLYSYPYSPTKSFVYMENPYSSPSY